MFETPHLFVGFFILSIFIYMDQVTVLLPGGFKPPHVGHLGLANKFASRGDVKKVIVMVGPTERDGINRQQSLAIWNLLTKNPKVEVVAVQDDNPMNAAFGYVFNLPRNSTETVALGASAKSPEDAKRSKIFAAAIERYKTKPTKDGLSAPVGVKVVDMTDDAPSNYSGRSDDKNGQSISARTLRQDLSNNDFQNFATNYPGVKPQVVKSIYKILKPMNEAKKQRLKAYIKQMIKEEDGFMDALVGPESKFKDAINKIKLRAGVLTKTAQAAQKAAKIK
jgi:hypothetical protein